MEGIRGTAEGFIKAGVVQTGRGEMLTLKEAIEQRRSIRKYKPDPVPEECISALLDAARLAPSGCNAQPWRFKVVTDRETRLKLAQAAYKQSFIASAPLVFVSRIWVKSARWKTA
jgi:nitroreductase